MMSTRDTVLEEIEAFLLERDMAAHAFGERAMNDVAFVHRLRGGRGLTAKTIDKVRAFMARARELPEKKSRRREARSAA